MLSKGVQDVILMSKSAAFTVALYMGVITRFLKVNPCYFVLIPLKKPMQFSTQLSNFMDKLVLDSSENADDQGWKTNI